MEELKADLKSVCSDHFVQFLYLVSLFIC
jgi:hypothetical protein